MFVFIATCGNTLTVLYLVTIYVYTIFVQLPDWPSNLDLNSSEYDQFRTDLEHLAESGVGRSRRAIEGALRGLCVARQTLELDHGCIKGTTSFESAGGFGYFLSAYSDGRLSKMIKSFVFDEDFYKKLKCPEAIKNRSLALSDRQELEKLLRFLLAHFLHIRVGIMKCDLNQSLKSGMYTLPIQISVARLFKGDCKDVEDSGIETFLKALEVNTDVKAAFELSGGRTGWYIYVCIKSN